MMYIKFLVVSLPLVVYECRSLLFLCDHFLYEKVKIGQKELTEFFLAQTSDSNIVILTGKKNKITI